MVQRSAIAMPAGLPLLSLTRIAVFLGLGLLAGQPARAQGLEPRAVVERAIRESSIKVLELFTPRMRALLEADMRKEDGIGVTWIAGGNDEPKITALRTEVVAQAGDAATVQARFSNYGDARRRVFILVRSGGRWLIDDARLEDGRLISADLRRAAKPPRRWLPTSNTAISVTGPVTLSDDAIRFGGKSLAVALVDGSRPGNWSDADRQQRLPARLYRVIPPSDPTLLRGNTLCGRPVTFIAAFNPTPAELHLNIYRGKAEPRGNHPEDELCASYMYGAQ